MATLSFFRGVAPPSTATKINTVYVIGLINKNFKELIYKKKIKNEPTKIGSQFVIKLLGHSSYEHFLGNSSFSYWTLVARNIWLLIHTAKIIIILSYFFFYKVWNYTIVTNMYILWFYTIHKQYLFRIYFFFL